MLGVVMVVVVAGLGLFVGGRSIFRMRMSSVSVLRSRTTLLLFAAAVLLHTPLKVLASILFLLGNIYSRSAYGEPKLEEKLTRFVCAYILGNPRTSV